MQFELALIFIIIWLLMLWFGAIALEATGMERRKARFQALSALTGTGFTTRDAEDIVGHPRRRSIASWLMFFGNAGIVLFVILLISYVGANLASLSLVRVGVLIAPIIIFLALIWLGVVDKLGTKLANLFKRSRYFTSELSSREIVHQAGDYSIARLTIGRKAPEVGCKIGDISLAKHKINILAIERGDKTVAFPEAKEIVLAGDHLLCYGKTDEISEAIK
jgi:ABC-type multidrug transport system fused ATPase/permease subunit